MAKEDYKNTGKFDTVYNINGIQFNSIKFDETEEAELESEFWDYWADLEAYAARMNLTTRYVEEEFLIDGELILVENEEGENPPSFPSEDF